MLALVPEMLGNRCGVAGALHAQQRRSSGRRGHHHGARAVLRAQNVFHELFDFAATLTNQTDHNHVGLGVARHHAQQHRLTHTRACKQTQTLATAHSKQTVDGTHAGIQAFTHGGAFHGVDGLAIQRLSHHILQLTCTVQRLAL